MRLSLLAMLPGALAAATAYNAHPMLLKAAAQQGCETPNKFSIRNLCGHTNGTADAPAPKYIEFDYADPASKVETSCQLNATSKSTTPEGLTPRFACENRDVKFIWDQDRQLLTLVERACHTAQGYVRSDPRSCHSGVTNHTNLFFRTPLYEAAGSISVSAPCKGGQCVANSTNYEGVFTSLQPVRDPTSYKMAYEMVALE